MDIRWGTEKDEWLRRNRNLSFGQVKAEVEAGRLVDDRPNPARPDQRILVVRIDGYVCAAPYVFDGDIRFLKTVYRSRDLQAIYGA